MRVVVVGGGFGGIIAALELSKLPDFKVTIISDSPHFHYQPGLYRTVTGISPLETAIPLREIFEDDPVKVELDRIATIDARLKIITAETGNHYRYDKLVVATGSVVNYFGIKGLEEHSFSMKTVPSALAIRSHLHDVLSIHNGRVVEYAVVGAGPTGVELAAELCFYIKRLCRLHRLADDGFRVNLIEAADRVLPGMPPEFSARVTTRLEQLGVNISTNTQVKGSESGELRLPDGSLETQTVVWTAGVANNPLFDSHPDLFELDRKGRVKVNDQLEAAPDIFVIGDNAATPYSGMAQTALYDGRFVTESLYRYIKDRSPRAYEPKEPVYVIPVGHKWASVRWGRVNIFGYMGWIIRRTADFRLLNYFLPIQVALRKWRTGNRRASRLCPVCDSDILRAAASLEGY